MQARTIVTQCNSYLTVYLLRELIPVPPSHLPPSHPAAPPPPLPTLSLHAGQGPVHHHTVAAKHQQRSGSPGQAAPPREEARGAQGRPEHTVKAGWALAHRAAQVWPLLYLLSCMTPLMSSFAANCFYLAVVSSTLGSLEPTDDVSLAPSLNCGLRLGTEALL